MALKPIRYPLTDGNRHSWNSLEAKFAGKIFLGFTDLTFSRKRSRVKVYGAHPNPLGKTRGSNEFTLKAKLLLAEFVYLTDEVLGGKGYADKYFEVSGTYTESGFDTIRYQFIGCTLDEEQVSNTRGDDATEVEIDLSPLSYLKNGKPDLDLPMPNTNAAA